MTNTAHTTPPSLWNRVTIALLAVIAVSTVGVVAMLAATAHGGPLDPASGPAPTRALIEPRIAISQPASAAGFPIVIDQPGSYYLATNITGVAGADGIRITANGVTLDLNGFAVTGEGVSPVYGIRALGAVTNLVVRNGVVKSWGFDGIEAKLATSSTFEDLTLTDNTTGLYAGSSSQISRVHARNNRDNGIAIYYGDGGGFIIDSVLSNNAGAVTGLADNFTIKDSIMTGNSIRAMRIYGSRNRVEGNSIGNNGEGVVLVGNGNTVVRNVLVQAAATAFVITGTNNHIGSAATAGTVFSADYWSNFRYDP